MKYRYKILNCFARRIKPFLKKFPHLNDDLLISLKWFNKESADSLGNGTYKFRLRSSDLRKGKSAAFRCIVYILESDQLLVPIAIFFKSERDNLSREEIIIALNDAISEMKGK